MKITIITPSFNSASTIKDTLSTVAAQKITDLEHLIMDGGSTDGTAEIVAQYPHATWISDPDKGIYDAMNKGIQRAQGEIIGILNSDDFYASEEILSKVLELFEDPSIQSVYGDLDYVDPIDTSKIIRRWRAQSYRRDRFHYGWMPPHPTFFVRREVYERFGLFNLDFKISADYELMLRFLYKNKLSARYLPQVLVKMRTGGASNASLQHRLIANKEDRKAWQINGLKPYFYTTWLKPIRKIIQWF